jgi:hypothetical protein
LLFNSNNFLFLAHGRKPCSHQRSLVAMQKFILAAILVLTAGSAQAVTLTLAVPGKANEFVTRYTLDAFTVASESTQLRGMGEIGAGTVAINEGTNELRLTLVRHIACPAGQICPQMMPAPSTLTLPIKTILHNACGGISIVAERELEVVGGGQTRVEVQDSNGGFTACAGGNGDSATFVKRIKVLVTEDGLRDGDQALSVLSGFPAHR